MEYANTTIHLLNVPFDKELNHTAYFDNASDQETKLKLYKVKSFTDYTYQRKDNIIRVNAQMDSILNCNYVMYKNSDYSNKWFYAFITDMKYIEDDRTDLYIETDPIQTWFFDYKIGNCFVEREHVKDDSIGLHTLPEGLETGEFICNELVRDQELRDYCYVLLVTEWSNSTENNPNKPLMTNFGGVPSSGGAYICDTATQVATIVSAFDSMGKGDAVVGAYMIPRKIVQETNPDDSMQFTGQAEPTTYNITFAKQNTLDGYTPRNNKLLTFPFNYLLLSNNAGTSNIIQYEHFSSNTLCEFEVAGMPVIGGSIKCAPLNYKGLERYQEEGIMCGKFPTLSWSSDLYTNWLTQNGVNIGVGLATSGASIVGGIGMSFVNPIAGVGMIAGGVMGVTNTLKQVHQQSFTPNSAKGNVNGGDINTGYKMNTFYFYKMSIKKEYAKIIDQYFDMYGYKVATLKTPNKNHRPYYWFTKTLDANITGAIPKNDIQKIVDAYNKGITFWKQLGNGFRNYNVDNTLSTE